MNIANLINQAMSDTSDLPDGYVRGGDMEIVPDVDSDFYVNIEFARVKESRSGNPTILLGFSNVSTDGAEGIAHFENFTFSTSSTTGTRITIERLIALGVTTELIQSGDLNAIADDLESITEASVYVVDHEEGTDGRIFPRFEWSMIKRESSDS
jgi:hypothetical protein